MCLPVLEAKVAKKDELEARLQQTAQDKMAHNQEVAQLHKYLREAKAKWVELQNVVIAATEHESSSSSKLII